ncbi:MAG: hypothetical protein ABI266_06340 [Ginsengibacter sp.]
MPKLDSPLAVLNDYLPDNAFESVVDYIVHHKIHLTITRERASILGNYKKSTNKNHAITVNGNLNKYSFLITLLHEIGHLLAFEKFGNRIVAHGNEWKSEYGKILAGFIAKKIFPTDIEKELIITLNNPAATSCAETSLLRVLKNYDKPKPGVFLLEDLPVESVFRVKNGKTYKKGKQLRKRFLCQELTTKKMYLFSPVAEVALVI